MHATPTPNGKTIEVTIYDARFPAWIRRSVSFCVMAILPVAIGIHFGSAPMQWVGFVFAIFAVIGLGGLHKKQNTYTSIDSAIAELQSMRD